MTNIIFDFDGTLADSLEVISEIFYQLNGKTRQLNKQEVAELRGLPVLTIAHRVGIPAWKIPFLLTKGRLQMSKHMTELKTFAGMKSLIRDLHKAGYNLYILSSNSTSNVRRFLHAHDISQNFKHVYGGVGLFSKPKALRRLIKRNGLEPQESFYICDEGRDIEAAKIAGLRAIAVTWGFANANTLKELEPYGLVNKPAEIIGLVSESK